MDLMFSMIPDVDLYSVGIARRAGERPVEARVVDPKVAQAVAGLGTGLGDLDSLVRFAEQQVRAGNYDG